MDRPKTLGMRHVALNVPNVEECVAFYRDIIGMRIEWQPDPDNVFLSSGTDNLAIHKSDKQTKPDSLDHIGFIVQHANDVDTWAQYIRSQGLSIKVEPKTHRDGARSFYISDPAGNVVQMMYHPPISDAL